MICAKVKFLNILIGFLIFLLLCLWHCGTAAAAQRIRVGAYQDPPAIWVDEQQQVRGFLPDLLEHIARQENWQIEYVPIHWCNSVEVLLNGEVDLLPGADPNLNSGDSIALSESPVYIDWGQVYSKKETQIQTILDLEGKRVAVEAACVFSEGESGIKKLAERFKVNVDFHSFTSATEALKDLYADKVDAIVLGRFYYNIPEMRDNVVKTPILLSPVTVYFGARKEDAAAHLRVVDAHIRELKANRASLFYQSWNKWFSRSLGAKLPKWLLHLAATLGGIVLLLLGFSLFARYQVEKKTREISEKNAQLRSLSMELTLAEEAERRRLAELLHDNLGQNLALTKIRLGAMEKKASVAGCQDALADIKTFLDEAIGVTRSLTTEMSPLALYNLTFAASLKWLAETILHGNNIEFEVVSNGQEVQLPEASKVLLFKTVRELLVNVVKHAEATYVRIEQKIVDDILILSIVDNGIGLQIPSVAGQQKQDGFGLLNIRERLAYLGGHFAINPAEEQGTKVELQIPMTLELKRGANEHQNRIGR